MSEHEEIHVPNHSLLTSILYQLHQQRKEPFPELKVQIGLIGLQTFKLLQLEDQNADIKVIRTEVATLAAAAIRLLEEIQFK